MGICGDRLNELLSPAAGRPFSDEYVWKLDKTPLSDLLMDYESSCWRRLWPKAPLFPPRFFQSVSRKKNKFGEVSFKKPCLSKGFSKQVERAHLSGCRSRNNQKTNLFLLCAESERTCLLLPIGSKWLLTVS